MIKKLFGGLLATAAIALLALGVWQLMQPLRDFEPNFVPPAIACGFWILAIGLATFAVKLFGGFKKK